MNDETVLASRREKTALVLSGILLFAVVVVIYVQTVRFPFVNYDDDVYVTGSPHVRMPFSFETLRWAFTTGHFANWHPLTWLSHMLDFRLFGLHAGGHHAVNVLFHMANTLMIFALLRGGARARTPGAVWWCAAGAAMFGLHPLRVESVAWVSERKDVLSAFFGLAALLAYVGYARRPALWRYGLVVLCTAGSLMAKSMMVTLPVLMLLLDFGPLGRWGTRQPGGKSAGRLILEKTPIFALACGAALIAFLIRTPQILSLPYRAGHALTSTAFYLWKTIWPLGLAVFYPHPGTSLAWWKPAVALGLLLAITAVVLAYRRKHPALIVGWFWYLVALAPASGIVQIGAHGMADRYTYFPSIGLSCALAWVLAGVPWRRSGAVGVLAGLVLLAGLSWHQTRFWRDSEALWRRAVRVTVNNEMAHVKLGNALAALGRDAEAEEQYRQAIQVAPESSRAYANLAMLDLKLNRTAQALEHARKAVELDGAALEARINLGIALATAGNTPEAIREFEEALRIDPESPAANFNLGAQLYNLGRFAEAAARFEKAVVGNPVDTAARLGLAMACMNAGKPHEAAAQLRAILVQDPDNSAARSYLEQLESEGSGG